MTCDVIASVNNYTCCRSCLLQVLQPRNRAPCPICKESITKRYVPLSYVNIQEGYISKHDQPFVFFLGKLHKI